MNKKKVLLIFPPQWIPLNPHFSLCSLAGHIAAEGYTVIAEDINVRFYRHILTERYLEYSRAKAENALEYLKHKMMVSVARGERDHKLECESARYLEIENFLNNKQQQFEKVKKSLSSSLSVFNDREAFYDPSHLVKAFLTVDKALEIVSLPFFPARIKFNDFYTPVYPLTVEGALAFSGDDDENPFLPFLKRAASSLLKSDPGIIGISINSPTQLYPGLTLARILKKKKHRDCHLNIGGNYFTRLKDALLERGKFFEHFTDSVIIGEGEKPLSKLIRSLERKEPLSNVPNLIYYDDSEVSGSVKRPRFTCREAPFSLNELHIQKLDHISRQDYFVPDLVVSIQSSKGCYWQKCTFCDTDFGIEPDIKSVDRLIAEIKFLKNTHGIDNFEFIDESILPDYMEQLANRINEEKLDVSWFSNARTESAFTKERLSLFRKSGLLMLLWGVESGSPRIMKLINKGVDLDRRLDILRGAKDAGIWNFAYIFFGFPTETREEAEETIEFLIRNCDVIHSYGRSVFTLGKHSKLKEQAKKLGIVNFIQDNQEFSTSLGYEASSGMSSREIVEMAEACKLACATVYGEPLWMYLRYREILFLYLQKYGPDHVLSFRFNEAERNDIHTLYM